MGVLTLAVTLTLTLSLTLILTLTLGLNAARTRASNAFRSSDGQRAAVMSEENIALIVDHVSLLRGAAVQRAHNPTCIPPLTLTLTLTLPLLQPLTR